MSINHNAAIISFFFFFPFMSLDLETRIIVTNIPKG